MWSACPSTCQGRATGSTLPASEGIDLYVLDSQDCQKSRRLQGLRSRRFLGDSPLGRQVPAPAIRDALEKQLGRNSMRTLEVQELDMVSGGAVQLAVIGAIKVGGAIATGLATLAGVVYLGKKAIEESSELCNSGSNVTMRTPKVEISCTAVQRPSSPSSSPTKSAFGSDDLLRARMPYEGTFE